MSASHTPWTINEFGEALDANKRTIVANGFATVMSPGTWQDEAKANTEAIVLAVNSHDELVEALTACAAILPKYHMAGKTTGDDEELSAVLERVQEALSRIPDIQIKGAA